MNASEDNSAEGKRQVHAARQEVAGARSRINWARGAVRD